MDHKFKSKWENNSIICDNKDYGYDGISWRQRSFMCTFCKKEYKSAQALGGHMNVHRRDRARLRLSSSPSLIDHPKPNPNPNPNFSAPPSSLRCLPYKNYHSSLFSLSSQSSTINKEDKQEMFKFAPHSGPNFLGDMRKNMNMEGCVGNVGGFNGDFVDHQEDDNRVWKKRESFRVDTEMGLVKDGKFEMGLDLELRLGRS